MLKLKYTIFDALVNFNRRRSVNIIVSVSFALGMLLPILCLGNINIFVENVSTMRFRDDENVWIAYFDGATISQKEIISSLQDNTLGVCDYAIAGQKRGVVEVNGVKSDIFISYLTDEWLLFEDYKIIEGSLDMFTGEHICLIEQTLAKNCGGLRAGDTITLLGDKYTVNGIFSAFHYYGGILLPLSDSNQGTDSNLMISKLYLRTTENISDEVEIRTALMRTELPVTNVIGGEELYHTGLANGVYKSLGIFLVGFVAFLFAAINIALVLIGKFNLDKRNHGIRMAMGASYRLVFLSALFENILCFCVAFLCDIGLVYILKPTFPEGLTVILNNRVYFVAFAFGIFMTVIVTWIALFKLKRKKLVELFERVS